MYVSILWSLLYGLVVAIGSNWTCVLTGKQDIGLPKIPLLSLPIRAEPKINKILVNRKSLPKTLKQYIHSTRIIICGDFNVDFLLKNKNTGELLDLANSYYLGPVFNEIQH